MAETLRGGLSLGLSGFGFWSHDIGGFESTATPDLYKRWSAFGLLSSHSRLHGSESYRVPWLFDEEAVDVLRAFVRLKCRLMPYLYAASCQASREGIPVLRAMIIEFPDDPACAYLDRQYMLGDSLLVAPVMDPGGSVSYYLPAGRWTDFLTGEVRDGGGWHTEKHGYQSLPLLVRPGTLIAAGAEDTRVEYDYADHATFHAFEIPDGGRAAATVYAVGGAESSSVTVARAGRDLSVRAQGRHPPVVAPSPWDLFREQGLRRSGQNARVGDGDCGRPWRYLRGCPRVGVTQQDIADALKISVVTVNRAMNGAGYVSRKLRERILNHAKEVHYVPHKASQVLVRNKVRRIALFSSALPHYFWNDIRNGVSIAAEQIQGFHYEVAYHAITERKSGLYLRKLREEIDAGTQAVGVVNQWIFDMKAIFSTIERAGLPYITLNVDAPESKRLCYIGPDYRAGGDWRRSTSARRWCSARVRACWC